MSRAQGINTSFNKVLGIMLSNGLVAFSGAFLAQYQGFADVKMGQGSIVIGLAAVIIGEAIFGKMFKNFALRLLSVALGSIIYYIVIQMVITLGFDANLMKLLSATLVAIFLAIPYWKKQYAAKYNSYKVNSQIRYNSDAAINAQIAADLADITYKLTLLENHAKYMQETIKTIDNLIYAISNRIRIEELIQNVK
jgi:putative ABC transport system permease protein